MTDEEFLAKLKEWLKSKRDEHRREDSSQVWFAIDDLKDEVSEALHIGVMPWELSNDD
jgi:hypothetical protein